MINITPHVPENMKIIDKYGDGSFTISKERFEHSVFVFPDHVKKWKAKSGDKIDMEFFRFIEEHEDIEKFSKSDVFLLGTGAEKKELDKKVLIKLREHNINVETMDTGAACRTYNVLLAEGRSVIAALIAV